MTYRGGMRPLPPGIVQESEVDVAERRRHHRITCLLPLAVGADRSTSEAIAVNLSVGGLCVRTAELEPVGSLVRLELELPELNETFDVVARVKHTSEKTHTMGLEFEELGEHLFETLVHFLNILECSSPGCWREPDR